MYLTKRKTGFTLIEIIIVVVILGILAAIALPKITANIGKSVASEGFQMGSAFVKALNRCLDDRTGGGGAPVAADVDACLPTPSITDVGLSTAWIGATRNFSAAVVSGTVSVDPILTMTAAAGVHGLTAAEKIIFTLHAVTGQVDKGCEGQFVNLCK